VPADLQSGGAAAIAADGDHTCALTTAGAVRCWGRNNLGQTTVLADLQGGGAAAIAAGNNHTCALTTAGAVRCWGYNDYGQAPATAFAGQALAFTPGTAAAGAPLRTLAVGQSAPLSTGTAGTIFGTWTPATCTVSGATLTATGPAGSLCGVWAAHAGNAPATAPAPTQMRLLLLHIAQPALALAASPASASTLGQDVTFTATLTGATSPTGTVTFMDGTATLCTATLPDNTCTAALAAGAHSITASYAGDASNSPATAPALAHTVSPASFPVTGGAATVNISAPAGCTLDAGSLLWGPAAHLPANATAPLGALSFTASGCAGGTLTVQVDYPAGSLAGLVPHKYGPASANATPGWFAHGGKSGDRVTYTVQDNGVGDNEPTPGAGVIEDPHAMLLVAPPAPGGVQAIPTLGEWGLLLLSALAALLGLRRLKAKSLPSA
jgi:hypothetical protein